MTDAHQIEPREEGHRMLSTNLHTSVKAKSGRLEMPCLLFRSDNGLGMNKKKYIWIGDWALALRVLDSLVFQELCGHEVEGER